MSESTAPLPEHAPRPSGGAGSGLGRRKLPVWLLRTIIGVAAAAVLAAAYFIAAATLPVVWANSISAQTGGTLGNAVPLGMFYGFVFSFVPVAVAWQAHHKKLNKWVRIALLVLALVLAIPNLLTLGVVYGGNTAAANARIIWAGSATWFGTWSQIFMVAGVVCAVAVIVLGRAWIRRGRKIREIKAAEKLVRENDQAKARAAHKAAQAAEKKARAGAKAAHRRARAAGGSSTAASGTREDPPAPDTPGTAPGGTPRS